MSNNTILDSYFYNYDAIAQQHTRATHRRSYHRLQSNKCSHFENMRLEQQPSKRLSDHVCDIVAAKMRPQTIYHAMRSSILFSFELQSTRIFKCFLSNSITSSMGLVVFSLPFSEFVSYVAILLRI